MPIPHPTPIFRLLHIDNLSMILTRGGLHAPNHVPQDGLVYRKRSQGGCPVEISTYPHSFWADAPDIW